MEHLDLSCAAESINTTLLQFSMTNCATSESDEPLNSAISYFSSEKTLCEVMSYDGPVPQRLVGFNEARAEKSHVGTVHYYLNDTLFECVWNNPPKYVPLLQQYESVIGPDFSQYIDMSWDERMFNNYRNWCLTYYWQSNGISVIPNVSWSTPDTYELCFQWIPKQSVIAIGSLGILRSSTSRYLWLNGYREIEEQLHPSLIIRYGDIIPGENSDISVYFQNERLQRLRQLPRRTNRRIVTKTSLSNQLNIFSHGW